MTRRADLATAFHDNVRNNQIGDTDGITPEVAADLGFETRQQAAQIIKNLGKRASSRSREIVAEALLTPPTETVVVEPPESQVPQFIQGLTDDLHAKHPDATKPRPLSQRAEISQNQIERLSGSEQ